MNGTFCIFAPVINNIDNINIRMKYYTIYIICFFLIACNTNKRPKETVAKKKSETELYISADLGELIVQSFEGDIYKTSFCSLVTYKQKHSGDGIFSISILNANNELFTAKGKLYTLKGENDTTVWECISNDGKHTFYFLLDLDDMRIFLKSNDLESDRLNPLHLISTKSYSK